MRFEIFDDFDIADAEWLCDTLNEEYDWAFDYHKAMHNSRKLKTVIPPSERGKTAFLVYDDEIDDATLKAKMLISNRFGVQEAEPGDIVFFTEDDGPMVYTPEEFLARIKEGTL